MTQFSITKYRYVEIVTATNEYGSYYQIPSIHDRHGNPYTCNTITQAKQMISRTLRGKSTNYRLSTNSLVQAYEFKLQKYGNDRN